MSRTHYICNYCQGSSDRPDKCRCPKAAEERQWWHEYRNKCRGATPTYRDHVATIESLRLTTRTDAERIKALEHDRATMWAECEAWRSGGIYMTFNGPQGPATELAAATDALPWVRERGTQSW